ncbi:helicase-related protein [Xanthomonas oryzae]|uniref:helicase-related protein n=1 Tax=Xanthomonas oryzae TaxID=347 RepID=UPI003CCFF142
MPDVSWHLGDLPGNHRVAAHHGSLSRETRLFAERRLKADDLTVLVATASLELGLDIGDVDLVCQLGSPRSIATFLQRAGRSGHKVGGTPKARLFPQTRDELVECAALLDSIRRGEVDALRIPRWRRSTCWRSRSWPKPRAKTGTKMRCSRWCGARGRSPGCAG